MGQRKGRPRPPVGQDAIAGARDNHLSSNFPFSGGDKRGAPFSGSLGVRRGPPGRGCPAGQGGSQISSPSARYKRSSYIPLRRVLEARNGSGSWLGFVTTLPAITTAFVRARPFCGCGPLLVFGALCAFHVVDRPACSTRHLCFENTRRYNTATRT